MRGPRDNACTLPPVTCVPRTAGLVLALVAACQGKHEAAPSPSQPSATTAPSVAEPPASASASPSAAASVAPSTAPSAAEAPAGEPRAAYTADAKRYAWLADERDFPKPDGSLEERFPAPPGYKRVKLEPGSFGDWLRT